MAKQNIQSIDQTLVDVSEQQSAQDWLPIEIMQISEGAYQGSLREIRYHDVSVFSEYQNCVVHKRGVMDDQLCTVSFARSINGLRFSEYDALENSLFFLPCGVEFDVQVGGGAEGTYFRFNQSQLLARARAINPSLWEKAPDQLHIFDAVNRKSLDAFTRQLYSNLLPQPNGEETHDSQALSSSAIMDNVLLTMDSSLLNDDSPPDLMARRRAQSLLNQVVAYVEASFDEGICPSIVDICVELNVSQRNLQYSFKKILGLTPNVYLYRRRLNRVRFQLAHPDNANVTVTQVALHWYFWNLGRFAYNYQVLFGELPSTTLRRALY